VEQWNYILTKGICQNIKKARYEIQGKGIEGGQGEAHTHVGLELGNDLHAERVDGAVVLQRLQHLLRPHHL
jgi:hypothetical protein